MSQMVLRHHTYWVAAIASLLLSCWVDVHEAVINPDAICYLYSAEEVGAAGMAAAMQLCPQAIWPFYSAILFAVAKLTHLSLMNTAFCLNAIFSAMTVVTFIAIVRMLAGTHQLLWLAALVILCAHDFNILRQDIIRDHGFWAFYLTSLFCLMRFLDRPSWRWALAWNGSLMLATIFRIEGAIFFLLSPWVIWFAREYSWRERSRYFFMSNVLLILMAALGTIWVLFHPHQAMMKFGRTAEVGHQLRHGLTIIYEQYQITKTALAEHILSHNSLRDAGLVAGLLLVIWYVVSVVNSLSLIYALLIGYAWIAKAGRFMRPAGLAVAAYLLINVIVTFGFFAENHFLAKRYLVALTLVLMLWVPFALARLARPWFWIAVFCMGLSVVGTVVPFGHSKAYIRQAGDWLAVHVPAGATLYANDYQLMYYSQHFGKQIFTKLREYNDVSTIGHGAWKQYDYLALLMGRGKDDKTALVMQEIHLPPQQVFVSDSGDHVYIYQIVHQGRKL